MTFNPNLLDDLFGEMPVVRVVPKRRIRAYSPEYYEWIGASAPHDEDDIFAPMPGMGAKASFTPVKGGGIKCDHPQCRNGMVYIYTRGKHVFCARCRGTGVKTAESEKAHQLYLARKASGLPMNLKYTHFLH